MTAETAPLISYPLRSSGSFRAALYVTTLLALATLGFALSFLLASPMGRDWVLWLLVATMFGVALVMWGSARTYLVPGGRGSLDIYTDRLELKTGRGTEVFRLAELEVGLTSHVTRYTVAFIPVHSVEADRHLELRTPRTRRTLSRRLFEQPDCVSAVANDVQRAKQGLVPVGLEGLRAPPKTPLNLEHETYEERLERELADFE